MFFGINRKKSSLLRAFCFSAAAILFSSPVCGVNAGEMVGAKRFATPQEAVNAFVAACKNENKEELLSVFGPDATELIFSGDPVGDKNRMEKFSGDYYQKNSLVQEDDELVLVVGERDWPFPIPLVKAGDHWIFDTNAGKEEILNRRIGENELSTVQTLLAIVDAQREYAMDDPDGDGIREYAEKFKSDPGRRNGLYWETTEGDKHSPLGELVADARAEGYGLTDPDRGPVPYHGYFFRMLKKQGKNASDGALDYIVDGNMIGGFAIVAFPAGYGNSGVMTFMVNYDGIVYQTDLGEDTEEIAREIVMFDPDESWNKVESLDSATGGLKSERM